MTYKTWREPTYASTGRKLLDENAKKSQKQKPQMKFITRGEEREEKLAHDMTGERYYILSNKNKYSHIYIESQTNL